ncbi:RNA-binding S4 domain-containing protein [Amnibacterium flavum]|uniref:RNA-binding protein S4 n=1 Tax=Amnibacterium flavum TaxID=2173173 RepID=A0A2V1HUJ3_9MICO|nr:S4 domain-containing protein [Amnibacterium flavum]PVZ94709.1 RNA-binding protein S4 [Amnibacterium flavum]
MPQDPSNRPGTGAPTTARVDSWLWAVRLVKTRAAATAACRAGHVRVRGERAKAAAPVRIGDEVRIRMDGRERIVVVQRIVAKRVSAVVAADCLTDLTPPPPPKVESPLEVIRDRGAGRPTKRERRDIEKFRGY